MLKVSLGAKAITISGRAGSSRRARRPASSRRCCAACAACARAAGVAGARTWKSIRKYRAGSARLPYSHNDIHNVRGLVLHAYEEACELLVFVRDYDSDDLRERAIRDALDAIDALGFAEEYRY